MRHGFKFLCIIAATAFHLSAFADARLDGMKQMNTEGCVSMAGLDPAMPKNAKQVKPFCTCTYDAYFDGFTKAEQDQLFSGQPLPEKIQKSLPVRLEKAQAQCRKKIGF